jgi:hypothetical protein
MSEQEMLDVRVAEITGSPICVTAEDGQILHAEIAEGLRAGSRIRISFKDVETLTSAFLNSAIGQLYAEFPHPLLKGSLEVRDIAPEDLELLKRVVEVAKEFSKDPGRFRRAARKVLGDAGR